MTNAEMFDINSEMLDKVAGGTVYDDPSVTVEEINKAARETAQEWKDNKWYLDRALDLLPRYFFIPGKNTKEDIILIIKEVYGVS